MVNCAIIGCNHKQGKHLGIRFFSVPTVITNQCGKTLDLSRRRRAEWIARIKRVEITENTVRKHHKVCGKHFIQGHPSSLFDSTNPDWAPSQDLGYENTFDNHSNGQSPEEDPLSVIPKEFNYNTEEHSVSPKEFECTIDEHSVSPKEFGCKIEVNSLSPKEFDYETEEHSVPTDDVMSMTLEVHEITVDSKDWKVELSDLCSEPSVKDVSVQTSPGVIFTEIQTRQDMTDTLVQPRQSFMDASSQTSMCSNERDKLEMERGALVQNVGWLNARLSESMFEAESFHKFLVEKNESLAEKNLKIIELEAKIKQLESTLSSKDDSELKKMILSEDNFRTDDKKVSFYTGLPSYTQLMRILNLVSGNVKDSPRYTLSKFQQFLMVVMWLRLGLEEQDLAYRFGLSQASVSRNLYRWLIPTASSLERFIVWPDRKTLQTHMPLCFQQKWKNAAAVLIDCFEIFTGRPLHLRGGGVSSQDKNQNTVKFLIAITPPGTISFISKSFVSHTSNEHITENCGLLDKLLPGDIIIADQGCNIVDAGGIMGARLAISDLAKGKSQLPSDDSELTREIANVRNTVKQAIGLVRRKYKILSGIPAELSTKKPGEHLSPIDHIARVCCALTNVCLSVAPLE